MARIAGAHEALTDQKRVICSSLELSKIPGGFQPTFSDGDDVFRNEVDSLMADVHVHAERPQIAIIDTHDRRASVERSRELGEIVDFNEHIETGTGCRVMELPKHR